MATEKQIIANQQNPLHTVLDLERIPVNVVRGEMPFGTDSQQKPSSMPLRILLITRHLKEQ
jgi:hypothetical protein